MKKLFVLLILVLVNIINAQPYYYTTTYEPFPVGHHGTGDMYRINMSNPAEVETLMTDVYELGSTCSDEYGNWIAFDNNRQLEIMEINNTSHRNSIPSIEEGIEKFNYSASANRLIVYFEDVRSPIYNTLVLIEPNDFSITDTIAYNIYDVCYDYIPSRTGELLYFHKVDTLSRAQFVSIYSLKTNQIINNKYLNDLKYPGADGFYFNFRRNSLAVVESAFILPTTRSYFKIYFLDNDSLSIPIVRDASQTWADGYIAKDGEYLLLIATLLTPDSLNLNPTGKIDIYNMTNGEMKKTIQLPPDGEVMCFENYPNDVWYVKNIELPEREIYKISFDSSSDEPKAIKLFPK